MNIKTLCILFAVVLAVGVVSAQTIERKVIANVPFGFMAAEVTFPAGDYSISRMHANVIVVDGGK